MVEKYCRNCNKPNPPDAGFCRHCASSDFYPAQERFSAPPPPQGQYGGNPWPPQNFGGVQGQNYNQSSMGASTRAITAAALAVVGLFCCGFLTGVPAAIIGWLEITAIKEGRSPPAGMWMAQVGLWVGIAGSIIQGVISVIWFFMMSMR